MANDYNLTRLNFPHLNLFLYIIFFLLFKFIYFITYFGVFSIFFKQKTHKDEKFWKSVFYCIRVTLFFYIALTKNPSTKNFENWSIYKATPPEYYLHCKFSTGTFVVKFIDKHLKSVLFSTTNEIHPSLVNLHSNKNLEK